MRSTVREELSRQANRVLADRGVRIVEGRCQVRIREKGAQAIQRVQRMPSPHGGAGAPEQLDEMGNRGGILSFEEQPCGRLAVPTVRTRQGTHEADDILGSRHGPPRRTESVGGNPPDPAPIVPAVQVDVLLDGFGDRPRVFDDLAVHVDHVKATVGSVLEMDRTKPRVGGREEFHALFIGRSPAGEQDAIGNEHLAMDEVASGIADEGIVRELRAVGVAAVDRGPRRAGEVSGDPSPALDHARHHATDAPPGADDAPGFIRAQAEHFGGGAIRRDAGPRVREGEGGIGPGLVGLEGDQLQVIAVAAHKAAPATVEGQAILRATGLRTQVERPGIKAEIASAEIDGDCPRTGDGPDLGPPVGTGRAVNAVVEAPIERVQERLDIEAGHATAKAGDHHLALVGTPVAGRVLQPQDVGRSAHEDPALGTGQCRWPRQVVGEDHRCLEAPVPIDVFQPTDPSGVRVLLATLGVIDHLGDIHPSELVEGDGHGTGDLRFGRGELDMESRTKPECRRGIRCGHRRKSRHVLSGEFGLRTRLAIGVRVADAGLGFGAMKAETTNRRERE